MKTLEDMTGQIRMLEQKLLDPTFRKSSCELADLLTNDFVEFGSSGRVFDKAAILRELSEQAPVALSLREFAAVRFAENVVHTTYVSTREDAGTVIESLRCSIWVLREGRWKLRFHQGTRRPATAPATQ